MSYEWLKNETAPKILVQAVKQLGVKEIVGRTHNPVIMGWAEELGLKKVYTEDEMALGPGSYNPEPKFGDDARDMTIGLPRR